MSPITSLRCCMPPGGKSSSIQGSEDGGGVGGGGGGEDTVVQMLELIQQTRAEHRKLQRLGLDTSGRGGHKYRDLIMRQGIQVCGCCSSDRAVAHHDCHTESHHDRRTELLCITATLVHNQVKLALLIAVQLGVPGGVLSWLAS